LLEQNAAQWQVTMCNDTPCDVPVIMTPQAAPSAFTENGTLRGASFHFRIDQRMVTDIQWSVYEAFVQVNLDIVGNESSCSKLSPSLRVMSVVVSYDYTTRSSIFDVLENVRAQAL
jgi:hypothetical protein